LEERSNTRLWVAFRNGVLAGTVSLVLGFLISVGGFAPFPPEAAIERFFAFVPASIESPMVLAFGGGAKYIGVLVASVISAVVYGVLGVFFERYYAPFAARIRFLTDFERFLLYSLVPWILFGVLILPLSGVGLFGTTSLNQGYNWLYPYTLLLISAFYGAILSRTYGGAYPFQRLTVLPPEPSSPGAMSRPTPTPIESMPRSSSRRAFLEKGALVVGAVIFLALSLENIISLIGSGVSSSIRAGKPSPPISPPIFTDPRLAPLVDSEITDDDTFYVVDIDFSPPSISPSSWSLEVSELGSKLKSYSLADLQKLPQSSQYTTFECVSNTVDGNLISNAKWTGVKLSDLISDSGADLSGVEYVVFYSVDGYSVGIPISKAMMSDSIIAYSMNDEDLPTAHGYPLRAVIPGLYGMMSAKWIIQMDLVDTTYLGYWQTRGYANDARINTLAFIRVPGNNGTVSLSQYSGSVMAGGIAFGANGISKVEVSVDGGRTWQQATLKPPISSDCWTLWAIELEGLSTGFYNIYARATDNSGQTQTSAASAPFPSGATGYATISFTVVE
jgi:DMSO/TMAO reductase YedYZ molybdopterin-dependent catalytic subunit